MISTLTGCVPSATGLIIHVGLTLKANLPFGHVGLRTIACLYHSVVPRSGRLRRRLACLELSHVLGRADLFSGDPTQAKIVRPWPPSSKRSEWDEADGGPPLTILQVEDTDLANILKFGTCLAYLCLLEAGLGTL